MQFAPKFNVGDAIDFRYDTVEPLRHGYVYDIKQQLVLENNQPVLKVESYTVKSVSGAFFKCITWEEIENCPAHACMAKVFRVYLRRKIGEHYLWMGENAEVISYYFL